MYQINYTPANIILTEALKGPQPPKGVEVFHIHIEPVSLCFLTDAEKVRKLHGYTEKVIKGVRYKVHCSYVGDANFKELYEKCLATSIIKLHKKGCAKDAAGN